MIGTGIGLSERRKRSASGSVPAWTLADFAPNAVIQAPLVGATTDLVMSGSDIISYTDPISGLIFAVRPIGLSPCTLTTASPLNGYAAIETSATLSSLWSATGGPGPGNPSFYMASVLAMPEVTTSVTGLTTCVAMGEQDGANSCVGIGTEASGPHTLFGPSGAQYAPFETRVRFLEETFDTTTGTLSIYVDGHLDNRETGRTAPLSTAAMGLYGWYYAYPVQHALVYTALWKTGVPSWAERKKVLALLGAQYAYQRPTFLIGIGDSITAGHIDAASSSTGVDDCSTTDYLAVLTTLYAAEGKTLVTYNRGQGGQRLDYFMPPASSLPGGPYVLPRVGGGIYDSLIYERGSVLNRHNIAVIMLGMNDLNQNVYPPTPADSDIDADAAVLYSRLTMIIHRMQADGFLVIAAGITPGGSLSAPYVSLHAKYNALVLANAAGAEHVLDVAGVTPWVTPDGVHPDNASYLTFAGALKTILDAAGLVT